MVSGMAEVDLNGIPHPGAYLLFQLHGIDPTEVLVREIDAEGYTTCHRIENDPTPDLPGDYQYGLIIRKHPWPNETLRTGVLIAMGLPLPGEEVEE